MNVSSRLRRTAAGVAIACLAGAAIAPAAGAHGRHHHHAGGGPIVQPTVLYVAPSGASGGAGTSCKTAAYSTIQSAVVESCEVKLIFFANVQ